MLPEHFYFSGAGWLGYAFYVPVALLSIGLIYWFIFRRISTKAVRIFGLFAVSLIFMTIPLWEAISVSNAAERLCKEQGGLHIYKTATADSFLGGGGIEYWSKYGFQFLEIGGPQDKKYKLTIKDGKEFRQEISEFESQYQIQTDVRVAIPHPNIRGSAVRVIDRMTGETLSQLLKLVIYPTRFDRLALSLLQVEFNPWICGNEAQDGRGSYSPGKKKYLYGSSDVIKATITPTGQNLIL